MNDSNEVAHHEAAHAVLAHFLDLEPTMVTIVPDEKARLAGSACDRAGSVRYKLDHAMGEVAITIAHAIKCMAGEYASLRIDKDWPEECAESDRREALFCLDDISPCEEALGAIHRYCELKTEALVEQFWPIIEHVASVLLKEKTMDGKKIRQEIVSVNDRLLGEGTQIPIRI